MPSFKGHLTSVQNSILRHTIKSGTPLRGGPLNPEFHFEVDHCLELHFERTIKRTTQTAVFRKFKTQSGMKMDPISQRTRFASFQRSSRGIQNHWLSRCLSDKF
ncbi:hypothetical protein RCL_jg5183.t1 [Rhizophagus clarus]|uniref:Uncharacterized protein n=1 Tax=Rhizophagus clarus TaxID=94130 RepID=A0A8H3QPI1_9GLOM|nr:hypothetical protein RCL_jg5183.t1 [Rhizophagus clarus]